MGDVSTGLQVLGWLKEQPEAALIVLSYLVGVWAKKSEVVKDKLIPLVVFAFSTVLGFLICGLNLDAAITGISCGIITVAGHATVKQFLKKDDGTDTSNETTTEDVAAITIAKSEEASAQIQELKTSLDEVKALVSEVVNKK